MREEGEPDAVGFAANGAGGGGIRARVLFSSVL